MRVTYSKHVAQMRMNFPDHQPMSEADFNSMLRKEKEAKAIFSSVRVGHNRVYEPTLKNYTAVEKNLASTRKSSSKRSVFSAY